MRHQQPVCRRHVLSMRVQPPEDANEPTTSDRDGGCVSLTNHVQPTGLMSFDGALDSQTGRATRSHVRDLLDLGIRSIFLDLSGVDTVDATGVCHLIEALDYANALGGGVAVLEE